MSSTRITISCEYLPSRQSLSETIDEFFSASFMLQLPQSSNGSSCCNSQMCCGSCFREKVRKHNSNTKHNTKHYNNKEGIGSQSRLETKNTQSTRTTKKQLPRSLRSDQNRKTEVSPTYVCITTTTYYCYVLRTAKANGSQPSLLIVASTSVTRRRIRQSIIQSIIQSTRASTKTEKQEEHSLTQTISSMLSTQE